MRSTVLAGRYAGALFGAARNADVIDAVESDLGLITYSFATIPRLKEVLTHPLISSERKKTIAAEVFKDRVQGITLRFMNLVIDKRRADILEDVEREYVRLANESRNIVSVNVTSAVPLTPDEIAGLGVKLSELTGKDAELQFDEDSSLIGGLTIRIGDTIIDGSVKGYLASLREQMLGRK